MIYEIIWSPKAVKSFYDRISYLQNKWTEREIVNFKKRISEYLLTLEQTPFIGTPGKVKDIRVGLIIKPVSLIYRIKVLTKEVELILFIDNRQNPQKIKKYK